MNLTKKTMIAIFLLIITLGTSTLVYSQDWPMFGHDPQNTGYSSSYGPSTGDLQWVNTPGGIIVSSPAVVDGKVYIGSTDGKLYCLDSDTGTKIWEYNTQDYIDSSPVVTDHRVYISSMNGKVHCLNGDTGALIWDTQLSWNSVWGVNPSSPVVDYGLVFITSENGYLFILDADDGHIIYGEEQHPPDVSPIYTAPTVADGKIYYALYDSVVRVIDYWGGSHGMYRIEHVVSSPALTDGKLYVGSEDHKVYCFDTDPGPDPNAPTFLWEYETFGDITSSPAVADGEVYISSMDGFVYCLNAYTGAWLWQFRAGTPMTSSPAVADNRVYIGGGDGKLYCLDSDTGISIWDYPIGGTYSSPAVADGKVYIASYDGNVYCIGSTYDERIAALEAENTALRSDLDALNARMRETEIKFGILPGTRLDIRIEGEYTISTGETTHVWHGFKSNLWSEYTEEQKTEFLSTAQWRFSVDGEEVLLDHVLRYTEGSDFMWSIYYRVFPPGYFKIGTHSLVGEWHSMEDGVWTSGVREAKLRVK